MTSRAVLALAVSIMALGCSGSGSRSGQPRPAPAHVAIAITYGGAGPVLVERDLLVPLEDAVASLDGVAHLHAIARTGIATLWLELTQRADPTAIAAQVRERVAALQPTLPSDAGLPTITVVPAGAVTHRYGLSSPTLSPLDLGMFHNHVVQDRLAATQGVRDVSACGVATPTVTIFLDVDRLAGTDVTIDELAAQIRAMNVEVPAGTLRSHDDAIGLRSMRISALRSLGDIARIERATARTCLLLANPPHLAILGTVETAPGATLDPTWKRLRVDLPPSTELAPITGDLLVGSLDVVGVPAQILATLRGISDDVRADLPEITTLAFSLPALDAAGPAMTHVHILAALAPPSDRRADFATTTAIAAALSHAGFTITTSTMRITGPGIIELQLLLTGADLASLTETAHRLTAALNATPSIAAAGCDPCREVPALAVELDHARLAELGITPAQVESIVAAAGAGLPVSTLIEDDQTLPITMVLRARNGARFEPQDLAALPLLRRPDASHVPLSAVTTMRLQSSPEIRRSDRQRAIAIWVRATPGTTLAELRSSLTRRLAGFTSPPGITITTPSTEISTPP